MDSSSLRFLTAPALAARREEEEKVEETRLEVRSLLSVPSERRTAEQWSRLKALLGAAQGRPYRPRGRGRRGLQNLPLAPLPQLMLIALGSLDIILYGPFVSGILFLCLCVPRGSTLDTCSSLSARGVTIGGSALSLLHTFLLVLLVLFNVPVTYVAIQTLLSLFAPRHTTGIVMDIWVALAKHHVLLT